MNTRGSQWGRTMGVALDYHFRIDTGGHGDRPPPNRLTAAESAWKAGTARAAITPKTPMWMSGYSSRTKPSQGAVHDLWAKARRSRTQMATARS